MTPRSHPANNDVCPQCASIHCHLVEAKPVPPSVAVRMELARRRLVAWRKEVAA